MPWCCHCVESKWLMMSVCSAPVSASRGQLLSENAANSSYHSTQPQRRHKTMSMWALYDTQAQLKKTTPRSSAATMARPEAKLEPGASEERLRGQPAALPSWAPYKPHRRAGPPATCPSRCIRKQSSDRLQRNATSETDDTICHTRGTPH